MGGRVRYGDNEYAIDSDFTVTYRQQEPTELRAPKAQSRHPAPERFAEVGRVEEVHAGEMHAKTI